MKTVRSSLVLSVVFIGLAIGNVSFAQNISVPPWTLEFRQDLTNLAIAQAQAQFTAVETYLTNYKNGLTNPTPQQLALLDQMIAMVQTRSSQVDNIAVYVADESSSTPGAAFNDVYDHFAPSYNLDLLQDVETKKQKAEQKSQILTGQDLQNAIEMLYNDGLLPLTPTAKQELEQLIQNGNVNIATGSSIATNPKTRISIMTVYLVPDSTPGMYTFEQGTAVVIATDN